MCFRTAVHAVNRHLLSLQLLVAAMRGSDNSYYPILIGQVAISQAISTILRNAITFAQLKHKP
jgi:hypothetical protein